jgi:Group 4 capsule polysaccharide lipoprotein gfcB, YjbF
LLFLVRFSVLIFFERLLRICSLMLLSVGLYGCAATSPAADVFSTLISNQLSPSQSSAMTAPLNSKFRYLLVDVEGRAPALLVLGYLDPHPGGTVEVWYSANREVLKTQNGRIIATAGLELDWRAVRFSETPPPWSELPSKGAVFERWRDEMPGYRDNIHEQMAIQPWPVEPPVSLSAALPVNDAKNLRWFREVALGGSANPLPPAWYGWGSHQGQDTLVYSQQCLSASFCLRLLRWPVSQSQP